MHRVAVGRTAAELGCSAGCERGTVCGWLGAHLVGCRCSRFGCAGTCEYGRGSVFGPLGGIVGGGGGGEGEMVQLQNAND